MGWWLQTSNGLPGEWEPLDLRPGRQQWLWTVFYESTGVPPWIKWDGPYYWKKAWSHEKWETQWWHWEVNEGRWSCQGNIFDGQPPGYSASWDATGGQSGRHTDAPADWRSRECEGIWRFRATPY